MAIIKERVDRLRDEYSFEEILTAYTEIKHHMSFHKDIKTYYKNDGIIRNVKCIAEELSKMYLESDLYAESFVDVAMTINKSFAQIEIKNLSKILSKDIQEKCINIANKIRNIK